MMCFKKSTGSRVHRDSPSSDQTDLIISSVVNNKVYQYEKYNNE
ncbi:hypothetical protein MNBD_GAMMA22-2339 [hydrothermal vent metagenome]|uniref:Uncharacterized protein n=1 Tax=hydrothermal vent metagenome TaxID=652676 RepID=A0A3B0ZFC1_9ZZZZ